VSTEPARGIHDHPSYKTGARPNDPAKPRLKVAPFLREAATPIHPVTVDDFQSIPFALDKNNLYGVCVPTGFDNFRRLVTQLLTGSRVDATWDDILRWYRTQNPNFDPDHYRDADDQGMNIQEFLGYLQKEGLILGFAEVDFTNEDEVRAAINVFLGLIIAVDLQTAQQNQTTQGYWDYVNSPEWGGHCVVEGAYEDTRDDVISWKSRIKMSAMFRQRQQTEAWVVILPEHVQNPNFRESYDLQKFAQTFEDLTGRPFPVPVTPDPTPAPTPEPVPAPAPVPPQVDSLDVTLNDTEVVKHILKSSHMSKMAPHDWMIYHFRRYFGLK
jgi:hypothetical protein